MEGGRARRRRFARRVQGAIRRNGHYGICSQDRLCFLGAAPFRTPTAKEKACAGRTVEVHLGGRAARARVKRVFVSDDEGPAHDETLCGLVDDAEPSRERTVRAAELLRAVRTATHVKWADAARGGGAAAREAPPAGAGGRICGRRGVA